MFDGCLAGKKTCGFLKLNQFYLFCQNHLGWWMTLCWKNILNHLELGAAAFVQLSIISAEGKETRSLLGSYFSQKLQLNLYTFWLNFSLYKSARVRAKLLLCPASAIGCNTQASTTKNNISDKERTPLDISLWLNYFGLTRIMRPSWATNWVHFFSRSLSTFQFFPEAQLEKSQIIHVLWIPTSFPPSVLYHLYSLFINSSFSLFSCLPCFLF